MSDPHPASQYALDPDGILLKYGPEAVMEHYYGIHPLLQHAEAKVLVNDDLLARLRRHYEDLSSGPRPAE